MHSSSHPPRAFHNRIARYLGVLVAAALVAPWGCRVRAGAEIPARYSPMMWASRSHGRLRLYLDP